MASQRPTNSGRVSTDQCRGGHQPSRRLEVCGQGVDHLDRHTEVRGDVLGVGMPLVGDGGEYDHVKVAELRRRRTGRHACLSRSRGLRQKIAFISPKLT